MFAIVSSYLKEPQLIITNRITGGVTSRILDTETLEERLQKEGETQPWAHSLRIDLFTLTDDGHYLLGWGGGGEIVAHACENSGFPFVPLNVQIQIIF